MSALLKSDTANFISNNAGTLGNNFYDDHLDNARSPVAAGFNSGWIHMFKYEVCASNETRAVNFKLKLHSFDLLWIC
jgi:hypothetical protein